MPSLLDSYKWVISLSYPGACHREMSWDSNSNQSNQSGTQCLVLPSLYVTSPNSEKSSKKQPEKKCCWTLLQKRKRKDKKEQVEKIWCSKGRRSYSRLLSPFHLQLPLYFPEPSAGAQTPLNTSTSITNKRRGSCPVAMRVSEACIRATAKSQGPWGVLSHSQTYFTQLFGLRTPPPRLPLERYSQVTTVKPQKGSHNHSRNHSSSFPWKDPFERNSLADWL